MILSNRPFLTRPLTSSQRLLNGGLWALSGKMITLPLSIVFTSLLTRLLSPEAMGQYVFIQSIVTAASTVALLGLSQTAVRAIAGAVGNQQWPMVENNIRNVIQWAVVGIGVSAVLLASGNSYLHLPTYLHLLLIIWGVIFAIQKILAELLRSFHDVRGAALTADGTIGGLITYIFATGGVLAFWLKGQNLSLNQTLLIIVSGGLLSVLWATRTLIVTLSHYKFRLHLWTKLPSSTFLWLALPLFVHDITTILSNQAGIWVLEANSTSSELALFGVAARLVALIVVPLSVVNGFVAPTIAELFQKGETRQLEKILRMLATLSSAPAWMAFGIFLLFGRAVLGFMFGTYYEEASYLLLILTFGSVINVSAGSCGLTLIMTGHQQKLMLISIISGITTLGATLLFARWYGALGVALAVTTNLIAKNLVMLVITKRCTGIWTQIALNPRYYLVYRQTNTGSHS
ncbi:MAG: oligosaccharide flippase family protein [Caldilineaceae bacterium]